ncbi:DUF1109 domain-containing protein [Bacillus sp. NP157]|nr:DUF1109 domain-containing protein [Bacillus sp. NP157]
MKTDDLIALLATETPAVDRNAPRRRFALAALVGLAGALLLMAVTLGLRPDLAVAARTAMFWLRLAYPLAIASAALAVVLRLSRPGAAVGVRWAALGVPPLVAFAALAVALAGAPEGARMALWLGSTWKVCPVLIAILSTPAAIAMFWAVRGMAPVRPRLAGAATGLFAGATATAAYCLHCPEMAPPFWAFWYLLGMLVPAAIGALAGRKFLRW